MKARLTQTPACFIDRDGTIMVDTHYPSDPEKVRIIDGVAEALVKCNEKNIPLIVVTNQSGIGRGLITQLQYEAVKNRMELLLAREGVRIDATYFCPHSPDIKPPCDCRKPKLGMYHRASRELSINLSASSYIGDRWRDVSPATSTGGLGFLIPGRQTSQDDIENARSNATVVPTLMDAIGMFLDTLQ